MLVLSHDVFNDRSGTVIAVALTSQEPRAGFPLTLESKAWGSPSARRSRSVRFGPCPLTDWAPDWHEPPKKNWPESLTV